MQKWQMQDDDIDVKRDTNDCSEISQIENGETFIKLFAGMLDKNQ